LGGSETWTDQVTARTFTDGATVLQEGDKGDTAFFILTGTAVVTREEGGQDVVLGRMGTGQCFGELALLEQAPRAATVRAEGHLVVLEIRRSLFMKWVSESPRLRDFLHTLRQIYRVSGGGMVTVYRGEYAGSEAITSVRETTSGHRLLATKVLGRSLFALTRTAQGTPTSTETVLYEDSDAGIRRTLHVFEGVLGGVVAEGPWPMLGRTYQRVASGDAVGRAELDHFKVHGDFPSAEVTGEFGPEPVCYCMQLEAESLIESIGQGCNSVHQLMESTGAGTICGGCQPSLHDLMDESSGPFGPR
jgi:bacterioferritin-associated ferredoxin